MQINSIIEYLHRICTPLALPFILAAAVIAWKYYRSEKWIFIPAIATIIGLFVGGVVLAIMYSLFIAWIDEGGEDINSETKKHV